MECSISHHLSRGTETISSHFVNEISIHEVNKRQSKSYRDKEKKRKQQV